MTLPASEGRSLEFGAACEGSGAKARTIRGAPGQHPGRSERSGSAPDPVSARSKAVGQTACPPNRSPPISHPHRPKPPAKGFRGSCEALLWLACQQTASAAGFVVEAPLRPADSMPEDLCAGMGGVPLSAQKPRSRKASLPGQVRA